MSSQGTVFPWAGWIIALSLALYILLHPFVNPHTCDPGGHHSTNVHKNTPTTLTKESFLEWMANQTPTLTHKAEWEKLAVLHGGGLGEGHMYTEQAQYYASVARLPFVHTVCEIGFNGGHSATMWLSSKPDLNLQSFDLGNHGYAGVAKAYVEKGWPGRFKLDFGDSADTVPAFSKQNPGFVCDIIHVDGGHNADMPKIDILNMRALARPHSILMMDDVACGVDYCVDPVKHWTALQESGVIEQWDCHTFYGDRNGFCAGRYLF